MNTVRRYKGYDGTAVFDSERMVLRGKILFVSDLVTYESESVAGIQKEFESAVDDYLETCAALRREPKKPCSGQFSVRIPQELHKMALDRAAREGTSLNDVVVRAMDSYLGGEMHSGTILVDLAENSPIISGTTDHFWENSYVLH